MVFCYLSLFLPSVFAFVTGNFVLDMSQSALPSSMSMDGLSFYRLVLDLLNLNVLLSSIVNSPIYCLL